MADVFGVEAGGQTLGPQLKRLLESYGLGSLASWARSLIIRDATPEEIEIQLYERPEFHARFPAIKQRESKGLPPIAPDEYLEYERMARSLSSTWDIDLFDADIHSLIAGDVSPQELEQRFEIAVGAVHQSPAEDRAELERLYGITPGVLARYWMNPNRELPQMQQQFVTGQIAGASLRTGYGQLTKPQLERLYQTGMTGEAATQKLGELQLMNPLFSPIDEYERSISRDEQVELLAGDVNLGREVEGRQEKRIAEFSGGGEFALSEEGFKGTGAATS